MPWWRDWASGNSAVFQPPDPFRAGLLVPLLTQHLTQRESFYIYYRRRTEQPLRVKAFIDFMVERLADNQDFFLTRAELTRPRKPGA